MSASVHSRESLWGLLDEAAEIEHNLMCCYLYALFSLRAPGSDGLTEAEGAAITRWRDLILGVAIEEMAHLANVCNILSALGAPAHFSRPNFPIPLGYHPAGMVVRLAPFTLDTLDHFIFLERPESVAIPDGAGFVAERSYRRDMDPDRLTPAARDYATVGQLYGTILEALETLAETLGEEALFIGDDRHQISGAAATMPEVTVVRCLKTARAAIEAIVAQGEGSAEGGHNSHYERFLAVRADYVALLAQRPDFAPAHPAAHNPVMRRPPTPDGKLWVNAEPAASLLDFGNAVYNHTLRCLALAYAGVTPDEQAVLVRASITLMHVLTPLAEQLATLPANPDHPDCTAGISFATLRSLAALPATAGALPVLAERLDEMAARAGRFACATHPDAEAAVHAAAPHLTALAARLRSLARPTEEPTMDTPANAVPASGPPVPIDRGAGVEEIPGQALSLLFNAKRCIHARHCVLGQPQVFKANVEGPWIDPAAASTEALVTVAHMCPSGAIGYVRHDGGAAEAAPPVNLVQIRENGPLGLRADIRLDGAAIGMRATLCRCGASRNKPFCDGSHNEIGFAASGEPPTRPSEPLAARGGALAIDPEVNGPLVVSGNLEICAGTGRTVDRVTSARLCRCGGSANKPFCDNSHRRNGFKS
jgi:CDGSH-type Zn-finger protein/uncharacterized Fe-S cluster protein YjdI